MIKGIELAAEQGARVTGIHVSPQFHVLTYRPDMLEETRDTYAKDREVHAKRYLDFIAKAAAESKVPCETLREISDEPFQAIINVARSRGCDLRDGFAWPPRDQGFPARQRDPTSADALRHSDTHLALMSCGLRSPGERSPHERLGCFPLKNTEASKG